MDSTGLSGLGPGRGAPGRGPGIRPEPGRPAAPGPWISSQHATACRPGPAGRTVGTACRGAWALPLSRLARQDAGAERSGPLATISFFFCCLQLVLHLFHGQVPGSQKWGEQQGAAAWGRWLRRRGDAGSGVESAMVTTSPRASPVCGPRLPRWRRGMRVQGVAAEGESSLTERGVTGALPGEVLRCGRGESGFRTAVRRGEMEDSACSGQRRHRRVRLRL